MPTGAQTVELLSSFTSQGVGLVPEGPIVREPDGTIYGTCRAGGSSFKGTVWKRAPAGSLVLLHTFNETNGASPTGLTKGQDGNLWGTCAEGGVTVPGTTSTGGTVFKITPAGVLTTIVQFNGANGRNPSPGLIPGPDGFLYGVALSGVWDSSTVLATVFRIGMDGSHTTLVTFAQPGLGDYYGKPWGALAFDGSGNLYISAASYTSNGSVILKRTPAGVLSTAVTHSPIAFSTQTTLMTLGSDGNIYGRTDDSNSLGVFFRLSPAGTYTVISSLTSRIAHSYTARFVEAADGNFYIADPIVNGGASPGGVWKVTKAGVQTLVMATNTISAGGPSGITNGNDGYLYGLLNDENTTPLPAVDEGGLFRLEIADAPPTITSALAANAQTGTAFSYTITVSDGPASFTATGLPAGLSLNVTTGQISGTPTVGTGVYNVTLTATNDLGTSPAATLVITVTNPGDALLPGLDVTGVLAGTTSTNSPPRPWFTQAIVSHDGTDAVQSGGPLDRFSSSNMSVAVTGPATVSFWWKTDSALNDDVLSVSSDFVELDRISGPDTAWRKVVFNVTGGAHNLRWSFSKIGTASVGQNAGWVDELLIEAPDSAPVFANEIATAASYAKPFSFRVVATDVPTTYTASGLPSGLTFNPTTGAISGTPSAAGVYTVSLSATNSFGTTASTLTLTVNVIAGALDTAFNPNLGNTSIQDAREVSILPDGKLMVSGEFLTVGGVSRPKLARLHADGSLDTGFASGLTASNTVSHTEVLPNGKVVITGGFSSIGGGSRNSIAMLNADGTIDPSLPELTPLRNADTASLSTARIQKNGKLIVSGSFFSLGGVARQEIARLNSDYTLDAFNPNAGGLSAFYKTVNLFEDGRLFLSGSFRTIGATARHQMARLTEDGVDDGFISQMTAFGICRDAAITPDGSVLAGRDENSGLLSFVRYLPNGTIDPNFTLPLSVTATVGQPVGVTSIATQCDGKIIIGGDFTSINGVSATRLARLHPNGTIDTTFSASANTTRPFSSDVPGTVNDVAIQADGRIVVAGNFLDINNQQRHRIARLLNEPATQAFSATTSRIEWLRGGSAPEADWVSFEQSLDAGVSWTHLGFGTRISGGWELTGLSLPAEAQLRGLARTRFGLIDSRLAGPAPEIAVEQPVGTSIADEAVTITYPLDYVGATSAPKTVLVRNRGAAPLTVSGVNFAGTNPGDYTASSVALPVTLVPEGSMEIAVRFVPTAAGTRTASLKIVSNDGNESPFDINLTGSAKLPPDSAPEITSLLTATASVPNFFSYQITATDEPSSYIVTGLPPGFSFSSFSGAISGTPQGSGVFNVQISATNAGFGTGPVATLVITITNPGDALRNALDSPAGNFQAPGAAPWFSQTAVSHDGVDAVQSGSIGASGSVNFTAAVTGPAIASWWWRTDCEATNDYLRVTLNAVEKGRISGLAGAWTRVEVPIPNGSHTLQFIYQKNASINSGADAAWVDELSVSPPSVAPVVTLTGISANAGSFISRTLTTSQPFATMTATGLPATLTLNSTTGALSGSAPAPGIYTIPVTATNQAGATTTDVTLTVVNPYLALLTAIELPGTLVPGVTGTWTAQTAITHDGVDAITSSPGWFNSSRFTIPVQGPATFSCWWKVNSGDPSNSAVIRLDGSAAQIAAISAEDSSWQRVEYAVPAGIHTVEITLDRFAGTSSPAATVWLDEVSIVSNSPDADTDGLPDAWETANFGSAGATNGTADADQDGLNNFGEYAFGLNPNSGNLGGLPEATKETGLLTMTITKQPYVSYVIEGATDPAAGSFSTSGLTIVTDNATTLTVRETVAGARRFLRVRATSAP